MLYFIPAWYQQNSWSENEQYWYSRRMRTEFDDTVKHIQLFHRSKAYPFQIMLLSYAPNFRHFLHRQGVFRAPYWSCFDAIQEIHNKKMKMFSFHNLNWPEHTEFVYSPFALVAQVYGVKYAQVEFGEDGNPIQVDIYNEGHIQRRNIYDDRGFVSSTIIFENEKPVYQDYLMDNGVWKLREFREDGHVEVNPKCATFLLEHEGKEYTKKFSKLSYASIKDVIYEVLAAYVEMLNDDDLFCLAMHELHTETVREAIKDKKMILSFFGDRHDLKKHPEDLELVERAGYIITDSEENLNKIKKSVAKELENIVDITPFDSRVDFGISQQLNVQKIFVPVDGVDHDRYEELIRQLAAYLLTNENAQVHLFTRVADHNRKKGILEYTRQILKDGGFEPEWAAEPREKGMAENRLDAVDEVPIRFFAEKCVSELSVSKCMREQRLIVDMQDKTELYLQITGISMGIPQIVYKQTQFVEDGKNGLVVKDLTKIPEAVDFYLNSLNNWNEAMVYSYELGKKYTTEVLIDKWKEVIDFVRDDSSITAGN
ncbi:MAG: accessory Sec system protein Asp1 [Roseburia sp.]|nr:accessory Sec system protein Asp1 [Roseburia sp.]